ncbi:hypothetical protein NEDG_00961 [Nematocida displodere]|uniref:Uncharacterized protein n=1 Tax=Nematocida displodere TaxID=1805483 RepID=A0A177ECC9_9MICR|nr:hypothetical protein NEDG_00961 [Nematocida displodere]
MLLSKEYLISCIRFIKPTYESLSGLVEYILLFPGDLDVILEIIIEEAERVNVYSTLFIVYLINELMSKLSPPSPSVMLAGKKVFGLGKKKLAEIDGKSTEALSASIKELKEKYADIEALWSGSVPEPVPSKRLPAEEDIDLDYLESLCQKNDKKKVMEYIQVLLKDQK